MASLRSLPRVSMPPCAKLPKRKRCEELDHACEDPTSTASRATTRPSKRALTMQMQASLALLRHLPALQVSGSRMGRRGGVDVGDSMVHALSNVLTTAQVTPMTPALPSKEDEERPSSSSTATHPAK
ncbi:hypothetical protein LEN26_013465 [Aphanomyces euteiches]|nr:hypothetical protein LEN26_013465 [Aphanomyces euteiches]KAH9124206.1 hypothetical protein AeMF1_004986 [Aphanomyces euteiches]KAH9176475.1 hypothetical protein AeNC1_017588 [Aphanomyces euteiches]